MKVSLKAIELSLGKLTIVASYVWSYGSLLAIARTKILKANFRPQEECG